MEGDGKDRSCILSYSSRKFKFIFMGQGRGVVVRVKKFRMSQKACQGIQSVDKERGKERENVFLLSSNAEKWTGLAVMHIRSPVSTSIKGGASR